MASLLKQTLKKKSRTTHVSFYRGHAILNEFVLLMFADSLVYAATLAQKATLWTQDKDFEDLPYVRYFPSL